MPSTNFDFERAMMLMTVMEKVANVAPKAMSISGLASAELNAMNDEAKAIALAAAEAERQRIEAERPKMIPAEDEATAEDDEDTSAEDDIPITPLAGGRHSTPTPNSRRA